jgi:hypothetical protein
LSKLTYIEENKYYHEKYIAWFHYIVSVNGLESSSGQATTLAFYYFFLNTLYTDISLTEQYKICNSLSFVK